MKNVEKIKPTGIFCNYIFKAIPLAFDESLSYYECLCGLLDYLKNTVIPTLNNNADAIIELQNNFNNFTNTINTELTNYKNEINKLINDLENYINNYFNNLNVQNEINTKLDQMVNDGTIANILNNELLTDINNTVNTFITSQIENTHGYFNHYGTQSQNLIKMLSKEFKNKILIYLLGDSITWGMNANPIGNMNPRTGQLSDPRNINTSPSYANILSDFLGNYNMMSTTKSFSNWNGSPSGDCIRKYVGLKTNGFYPTNSSFTTNSSGTDPIQSNWIRYGYVLNPYIATYGVQTTLNYNSNGTSYTSLKFNVEKINKLNVLIQCLRAIQNTTVDFMQTKISVYSNNNFIRDYVVTSSDVDTNGQYDLEINFNNDITGEIELRYSSNGINGLINNGTYRGGIWGYYYNKQITIINQGIIGINTMKVLQNVVNQNGIKNADFVITQIGTNDRIRKLDANDGDGFDGLYYVLTQLDNEIKNITTNRIYMASNNCNDISNQVLNQEQVRNCIKLFCLNNNIDFIDNYQASLNYDKTTILSDGLHPNNIGHQLIANNIITSLLNI